MIRSPRLPATLIPAAVLLVTLSPGASESRQQDPIEIGSGTAIERHVVIGEEHLYRLTLAAAECATVVVAQRGIDVVVRARRVGGTDVVEFQEEIRRNGEERVDIVADEAGTYTLAIASSRGVYSGTYTIRVAARRPATDSDRSLYEARRLRTAAQHLTRAARHEEARHLLERALAISESGGGPNDALVGIVLYDLAGSAIAARDDASAEPLCRRALAIFEQSWGAGHPYSAMAQSRLAQLLQHAGRGPQAEALLRPAIQLIEETLGPEHSWLASCLATQAALRYDAGDRIAAETTYRRAMAILEQVGATDSAQYAGVLNNLGLIYADARDLVRAEEFYQRALALAEKREGTESYNVSIYLQNLGIVARQRKDHPTALAYTLRALSVREAILGADHVDIAPLLNNLAILYRASGDVPQALAMFDRSLHLSEKAFGPYHRGTLMAVGNIARTYADIGEESKAISFQRRADTIIEKLLELNLAVGSERQKLAFVKSISERTDRTISLHLQGAPGNAEAAAQAALVVLQRKGRVLDAMTDTFAAVRRRVDDGGSRALLDQLNSTTRQLARLVLSAADGASAEERQRAVGDLEAEKERLEVEIGAYSGDLRSQIQVVTLEAVRAAIPDDAALLEFAIFRPFDPKAQVNAEAYGPPHYAAYVVRKNDTPRGVDLGPAALIDRAVEALRQALRDRTSSDVKARARAVYDLLMRPLRASCAEVTRLLVSPDGLLNLVPFEALADEHGRYLIASFSISYLGSGRELLRMGISRTPHGPPVIVADPDYGEPAPATAGPGLRQPSAPAARYRSVTTAIDQTALYFAPLANTAEEARAINGLFPDAVLLTRQHATKAAVARLDAPRILHIASHGFFLQNAARGDADARAKHDDASIENPLLRSGIALSGANLGQHGRGDGILTALEASGLNLWGTRLVTLSACDTGVGEVHNGEGVYGLRRAFLLAGTETLVMSLWPVSDYIARETMVAYYAGLRAGLGRGEALRQAKIAMLTRKGRQHPFYWASFIQSGEWAGLDGRR
jgi:CHAT domain-containing protein